MADKKWSQFPSATPENDDVVVGLHAGGNVRFTVANFVLAVRQGLINLFVPQTRTVNGKALSSDISLTMDDISNGTTYAKTTAAQVAQIGTNQANIGTIEGKIPSAASTSNQLADKAFVTDAITQGTAIFRGSFASRAALLAVAWQTTDPDAPYYVSNNDYAVVLDDETQNDECWRYIYVTGTGWTPQYRINESPLTQAQLDALNSGATAAIINSVADKLDKTGDGKDVTATFTAASTRANISTGEKLSVLFGKIAKWFSDLGTAAFRAATGSITSGSTDLVESGAVYIGLAGKQSTITASGILKGDGNGGVSAATPGTDYQAPLTIDATPTASSTNPVQSGGVYSATAGYGLGVMLNTQTAIADCDSVSVTGWFNTDNNTLHCPTGANKNSVLYCVTRGAQYAYQEFHDQFNAKLYRRWKNQTSPWEAWYLSDNGSPAFEQQLAYVETGTTASRAYAVGEYFCWNGLLYRVTAAISSGGTFTPGTNCEQVTEGGFNAFLPSITNGTLDTTKASGYAQAISSGSLHMVFFKLTTSVAVATTDTLVTFPSGNAPTTRQLPLQFLFQRPSDTAPVIRGDRAGAYFNTNGTITQSLSNALTVGTLLQGLFIWVG